MKKQYRFLIEKWSNQEVIELTEEEYSEFQRMNLFDQESFIESKYPHINFDVVNIELTEVKKELLDE